MRGVKEFLCSFTNAMTGEKKQTLENFFFLVCFICDTEPFLRRGALKSFAGIQVYLKNTNMILATKDCGCVNLVKERGGDRSDVNLFTGEFKLCSFSYKDLFLQHRNPAQK